MPCALQNLLVERSSNTLRALAELDAAELKRHRQNTLMWQVRAICRIPYIHHPFMSSMHLESHKSGSSCTCQPEAWDTPCLESLKTTQVKTLLGSPTAPYHVCLSVTICGQDAKQDALAFHDQLAAIRANEMEVSARLSTELGLELTFSSCWKIPSLVITFILTVTQQSTDVHSSNVGPQAKCCNVRAVLFLDACEKL